MTIYENAAAFAGKQVRQWSPAEDPIEPYREVPRLTLDYDSEGSWADLLDAFLATPAAAELSALVVGAWWGEAISEEEPTHRMVEALVGARDRLPALSALFIGDITSEESEISWIRNTDLSPVLLAFPGLVELRVRGGDGLELGSALSLPKLRRLTIETGGLDDLTARQIASAELPVLEHLELWLGEENYGGSTDPEDVEALLARGWPALRSLGLRNAANADALVPVVLDSPVYAQLEVLDLSLGTLGDAGATALLETPGLDRLRRLDVHHHYISAPVVERLAAAVAELDASDPKEEEEYGRYIFVGE